MTRAKLIGLVFLIAGACGACGAASSGKTLTPEQIQAEPTPALCDAASQATTEKPVLLQEMLRRHAIRDEHVAQIRDGTVVTGMNSCETIAAWGPPVRYSSTPGMDFPSNPAIASAAMVYDYDTRGKIGFDTSGLVKTVSR